MQVLVCTKQESCVPCMGALCTSCDTITRIMQHTENTCTHTHTDTHTQGASASGRPGSNGGGEQGSGVPPATSYSVILQASLIPA
eukprot:1140597-Pelagomonas_calceolata.AAC.3